MNVFSSAGAWQRFLEHQPWDTSLRNSSQRSDMKIKKTRPKGRSDLWRCVSISSLWALLWFTHLSRSTEEMTGVNHRRALHEHNRMARRLTHEKKTVMPSDRSSEIDLWSSAGLPSEISVSSLECFSSLGSIARPLTPSVEHEDASGEAYEWVLYGSDLQIHASKRHPLQWNQRPHEHNSTAADDSIRSNCQRFIC